MVDSAVSQKKLKQYKLKPVELVPIFKDPEPLGRTMYFRKWFSMGLNLFHDWGYDPVKALAWFLREELGLEYKISRKVKNMEDWMELFPDAPRKDVKQTDEEEGELPF